MTLLDFDVDDDDDEDDGDGMKVESKDILEIAMRCFDLGGNDQVGFGISLFVKSVQSIPCSNIRPNGEECFVVNLHTWSCGSFNKEL